MIVWTLSDALALARSLNEELQPRYHSALTGSVLFRGWSGSDLDLIVYPRSTADLDDGFVPAALARVGLRLRHDRTAVHAAWRLKGSQDEKHVEVWEYEGKKVDIFYLR